MLAGAWAYWTTLEQLVHCWRTQPDYSHGFLAPFVAAGVLYVRRGSLPPLSVNYSFAGVGLLAASIVMKIGAAQLYLDSLDHWSLVIWIAGVVAMFYGMRVTLWAWPAIIFLLLAMPLPFRLEQFCSQPLQRVATLGSVFTLQTAGFTAFAEGNLILLGEHRLEVERACAGLRIFLGVIGLTVVAAAVSGRSLPERCLLLAAALPVAIVANVLRIVLTAFCFTFASPDFAATVAHDAAGWTMIPFAAALIALVYWYLTRVFDIAAPLAMTDVLQRHRR